jgi:hypothetical protein
MEHNYIGSRISLVSKSDVRLHLAKETQRIKSEMCFVTDTVPWDIALDRYSAGDSLAPRRCVVSSFACAVAHLG